MYHDLACQPRCGQECQKWSKLGIKVVWCWESQVETLPFFSVQRTASRLPLKSLWFFMPRPSLVFSVVRACLSWSSLSFVLDPLVSCLGDVEWPGTWVQREMRERKPWKMEGFPVCDKEHLLPLPVCPLQWLLDVFFFSPNKHVETSLMWLQLYQSFQVTSPLRRFRWAVVFLPAPLLAMRKNRVQS